ncbi:alpha/beta hydrolase [Paraburkholderia sp. D15]|uniref:alpha/beta hydrolase n=1 Tax=Paraburkholderia sp. D15 TaxID=2880218 RepID=UPI0024790325|nr:alpha/beta hydrolase [Paraburkholderia sp. D15]WGS50763.1 alpha/beta hydrolase [Paraburkholderia sp. D15]WKF58688.1 Carboxylesterase NlhH [Paraburkholderia busanensis]
MTPRRLLTLTAALALTALSGCSPAGFLNAAASRNGFHAEDGIAYGDNPRQQLDVYTPGVSAPPAATRGRPVVVFLYGGSWQNGSRGSYLFVGAALASRGFVAVLPDYRTWPETGFPGFVDDAARAVRWARDHAAEFGGDPSRIFLMGHSAGAHIVMLLATDDRYLAAQQMSKRDIAGVIGLAGPYDFLPLQDATLERIFPLSTRAASQPINFVAGDEPPMFLAAGERDTTVDPGNTDRLAAKLRAAGDRDVEVKHYPRVGHALLVGAIAGPLRGFAPVLDDTVAFIDAQASVAAQREGTAPSQPQGSNPSKCLRNAGARVDGSSQMPKNACANAGSSNSAVTRSPA